MFKVVALVACWGWDYWLDIRHEDPALRSDDEGPSRHEFTLLSSSTGHPSADRIEELVATRRAELPDRMDGHGELHSYAVLEEAAWARLVEEAPAPLRRSAEWNRNAFPSAEHQQDPTWLNLYSMDLEEALRMWAAAGVAVQPAERHGLSEHAPALVTA